MAHGLSCSTGMWDLPATALEPVSPALAGGFLTTAPPGEPSFQNIMSQATLVRWGVAASGSASGAHRFYSQLPARTQLHDTSNCRGVWEISSSCALRKKRKLILLDS